MQYSSESKECSVTIDLNPLLLGLLEADVAVHATEKIN